MILNSAKSKIIGLFFSRFNSTTTTCSFADGVQTITLNSPKTRNSLSLEMMRNLRSDLQYSSNNSDLLRCVLIRSTGSVFSAGHNLKELDDDYSKQVEIFEECNHLMLDIVRLSVPVIAAVNGLAAAAGCQLVSICDIAVATKKSSFSTPGSSFGLFCSTPGVPLARMVPRKISSDMLLTGRTLSGQEALNAGLISRLTENDENALENEIEDICEAIKSKPKAVVELGKRFYHEQLEMGLSEALEKGSKVMLKNLAYCDAREGLRAFKEKRNPTWTHTDKKI